MIPNKFSTAFQAVVLLLAGVSEIAARCSGHSLKYDQVSYIIFLLANVKCECRVRLRVCVPLSATLLKHANIFHTIPISNTHNSHHPLALCSEWVLSVNVFVAV